jgi:hypothetical protein
MSRAIRFVCVAAFAALVVLVPATAALAHVDVDQGPIHFAVGFGLEPAYAGQPNSAQVLISNKSNDQPIADVPSGALTVEVGFGTQTTKVPVEPDFEVGEFGSPGDYRAWFIPSQPGTYSFHVTGTVHGQKVDFTVKSGPKTFSEVIDPNSATFPAVNAPTAQDLATRIDAESSRAADVQAAATSAANDASSAKSLAFVGIILGAIGVIAGIAGLAAARRRS